MKLSAWAFADGPFMSKLNDIHLVSGQILALINDTFDTERTKGIT